MRDTVKSDAVDPSETKMKGGEIKKRPKKRQRGEIEAIFASMLSRFLPRCLNLSLSTALY